MEKYFCNYNQSLALKELGFDEPCWCYFITPFGVGEGIFNDSMFLKDYEYLDTMPKHSTYILAPLKSQVFEWFRKQGYDTKIHKEYAKVYLGFYWTGAAWEIVGNGSYEEAESACIDKLIEIVQNNLDK